MTECKNTRQAVLERMRRCARAAAINNLFDNAVNSTPTVTVSTTSLALGQNISLTNAANYAKLLNIGGAFTVANSYLYQYSATCQGTGNIASLKQQQQCAYEVMMDSPKFELYFYSGSSTQMRIAVGTTAANMRYLTAAPTAITASLNQYAQVDMGGTYPIAPIRVRFEVDGSGLGVQTLGIVSGATIWKPKDDDAVNAVWLGDSYFCTGQSGSQWPHFNIPSIASLKLGWRATACALSGTGFASVSAQNTYGQRIAAGDLTRQAFDIAIVCSGPNEPTVGSAADPTVQPATLAALQAARVAMPTQPIIVLGSMPGATGPSAARIAVENAILAAFTQWGDPNSVFIPVSTDAGGAWISGTGYTGATNGTGNSNVYTATDHVHLFNPAGGIYVANRVNDAIRDWLRAA